jgi:hypothetical protein
MTQKQKADNIIKGLQILNKYKIFIKAYKGELWCEHTPGEGPGAEGVELKELGWKHNLLPMAWWIEV